MFLPYSCEVKQTGVGRDVKVVLPGSGWLSLYHLHHEAPKSALAWTSSLQMGEAGRHTSQLCLHIPLAKIWSHGHT